MTIVRRLYERFWRLLHEVAKFGVVGAAAFLVTAAGTNLLRFGAGVGPVMSNLIASVVATFVSFAGNRYWTFRHREGSTMGREYLVFFVLNALGLGIQLACIWFAYYILGLRSTIEYNVDLVFGIGVGTLFRFWSYRRWVWLAPPIAAPAGGAAGLPGSGPDMAGGRRCQGAHRERSGSLD